MATSMLDILLKWQGAAAHKNYDRAQEKHGWWTLHVTPCTYTSALAQWPTPLVTGYDRLRRGVRATDAEVAEGG